LRGAKPGDPPRPAPVPPSQPSADQTRAMPIPREQPAAQPPADPDDATTAIPTAPRQDTDPETATEKVNARGENGENGENPERPRRRGGGLSAQDLLRREGRI
jgi:RND superfamily putative drug exporter